MQITSARYHVDIPKATERLISVGNEVITLHVNLNLPLNIILKARGRVCPGGCFVFAQTSIISCLTALLGQNFAQSIWVLCKIVLLLGGKFTALKHSRNCIVATFAIVGTLDRVLPRKHCLCDVKKKKKSALFVV